MVSAEEVRLCRGNRVYAPNGVFLIGGFANFLDCRQEQPDQNRYDRNDPNEFDQRESALSLLISQDILRFIRHDYLLNLVVFRSLNIQTGGCERDYPRRDRRAPSV